MRVISHRPLREFAERYPHARIALQTWRKHIESRSLANFSDLRNTFRSVDLVRERIVFDIRGNRYRLITFINFARQECYIKAVLTHNEYDKKHWMTYTHVRDVAPIGWGLFQHTSTVRPIVDERDHDLALSAIDRLVDIGAMNDEHPKSQLCGMLFDVIHAYEQAHYPF